MSQRASGAANAGGEGIFLGTRCKQKGPIAVQVFRTHHFFRKSKTSDAIIPGRDSSCYSNYSCSNSVLMFMLNNFWRLEVLCSQYTHPEKNVVVAETDPVVPPEYEYIVLFTPHVWE